MRIEEIAEQLMRGIRYRDKLIDELAKGKPMAKILRLCLHRAPNVSSPLHCGRARVLAAAGCHRALVPGHILLISGRCSPYGNAT